MSPHASPIAISGGSVLVVNTPSDTVDVIDCTTREIASRIDVGIDPVSIAVRPDGKEVWVSNHISDSVSVIDNQPLSVTYLQVVATIEEFDPETKATRFDEPVGIAFAGNERAYVALSSENEIAVIDNDLDELRQHLSRRQQQRRVNDQQPRSGSTPLSNTNEDSSRPLLAVDVACHVSRARLATKLNDCSLHDRTRPIAGIEPQEPH